MSLSSTIAATALVAGLSPLVTYPVDGTVQFNWNTPQSEFLSLRATPNGPLEYIDYEGAVRAGKTTAPAAKACDYAIEYPGIHMAIARWKDQDFWGQVVPRWREIAKVYGLTLKWYEEEQYDEIVGTGSRMYLKALHTNELDTRYSKLAGLTLAVIWIDQAEEVPRDVVDAYIPARLSQPNYPHEVWLTPNPVDETDHWIADWFPIDTSHRNYGRPHYHYIQTSLYDNIAGVGQQYVRDMEDKYPPGHALRRRFIEGKRGLSVVGQAVYAAFRRSLHVDPSVVLNPALPLIEAWDFGHHHPAVLWSQFAFGSWHVLGEVMGQDQFIEDFAPWVAQQRQALFPAAKEIWWCCDPAGAAANSHGVNMRAVDVLERFGMRMQWKDGSNSPTQRDAAIQRISAALSRLHKGTPAVRIHPRARLYIDGLEAGYVWDEKSYHHQLSPNTRRPLKDGRYDHLQNDAEYTWLNFGPIDLTAPDMFKMEQRQIRHMQRRLTERDHDPDDKALGRGRYRGRGSAVHDPGFQRGGYK